MLEPPGTRSIANHAPIPRSGDEPRWNPARRRVVDTHALECGECIRQIGDARLVDGADVALRTMTTTLCPPQQNGAKFSAIESVATKRSSVAKP